MTASAADGRKAPLRPLASLRFLIFDLDGTLVDSYAGIRTALNAALAAHGVASRPLDEVRAAVGHGLDELLARYLPSDSIPAAVLRFREVYREVVLAETQPLPGARESLAELRRRGFGLAVASNKPAEFSRQILDHLGLAPLLRSIRGPSTDVPPKPDPAMLQACLTDLGATQATCAYVGDMALDVESGNRAGLPVLLVATGSSTREALVATGEPVFASLREMLAWIPDGDRS